MIEDMSVPWDSPMIVRSLEPGGLLRVNRAFEEALGLDASALAETPLAEWIHAEDLGAIEACSRGETCSARARHRDARGAWHELEWLAREHDGELVLLGRLPHTSEDQQLPERDDSTRSPLSETLDAMARIVEAKNPGKRCSILLVDEDRTVITRGAGPSLPAAYNEAVEGLRLGPGVGSCGTAAFWNVPVIVEDIFSDVLWRDLRDAARLAGVAACWSHPVTDARGRVLGAMAIYSTEPASPTQHQMDGLEIAAKMVGLAVERDRLEARLNEAARAEALGLLAGGVAHDFNNLLAGIVGHTELALDQLGSLESARRPLEEVMTASAAAADLCDQLLAYAGRAARCSERLELNDLVSKLTSLLRPALPAQARVELRLARESTLVEGDPGQLRQVILNLLTNAAEALGEVGGRIEIGTRIRDLARERLEARATEHQLAPGEYVELWVSDDGGGMDATTMAHIFDPFFTTKSQGRGLGLAAVRGIVEGHGGGLDLESEVGRGTHFSLLLPHARGSARAEESAQAALEHKDRALSVLVIDDEPSVRDVLAMLLESAGHQVHQAASGAEALDYFEDPAARADAILLDLSMPEMGGEEVFTHLRGQGVDAPVLLLSGFAEQEVLERFRGHAQGLAGFLRKPVRKQTLLSKLSEVTCAQGAH